MTRILVFFGLILAAAAAQPAHAQTAEPLVCPLEPYVEPTPSVEENWGLADDAIPNIPPIVDVLIPDDGSIFVVVAKEPEDATPTLYRYAPESGELGVLVDSPILDAIRTEEYAGGVILGTPTFIPGTHTLLFYTEIVPNNDGMHFEIPLDLWSLDVDTGTLAQVLPFGEGGSFSISPSGEHLVLYTQNTIRVGNPDGTNLRVIYEGTVGVPGGEFIAWPDRVWMGDHVFRAKLLDALDGADPNAGLDPRILTQIVEFDLSAESVTPEVILSIPNTFYFTTRVSPAGDALAYWTLEKGAAEVYNLTIAREGAEPVIFASGYRYELRDWVSDQHVTWYDPTEDVAYIADVCGDSVPLN